jgi:hypothetical protein
MRRKGPDVGPVDHLAATVAQHEELTESFKTSNALLQNSLSYVGLLSTDPVLGARDAALGPQAGGRRQVWRVLAQEGALAAATLHLARDTSSGAVAALQERIEAGVEP